MKKTTKKLWLLCLAILFACIGKAQMIITIAGNGTAAYAGDGGQATAAELNGPSSVALDGSGNLYIADQSNNCLRKISASGIITTIAGNGTAGFSGDGGQATAANLNSPIGVIVDGAGNLYFTDRLNNRLRKINTSGVISTIVGNGTAGFSGDGGQATAAEISNPAGLNFDASGNLYIADKNNNRIRKVTTSGVISTVVGNGTAGFSGDGGQATVAEISNPVEIDFDASGNLYIADKNNNRIRKVTTSGVISTIAGNGTAGFSGDGGQATAAELSGPSGIDHDISGNLYISDRSNNRVRKVATSGIITTVVGNGTGGYSGDGGYATAAELDLPNEASLAVDASANYLYIADFGNNRIRKVTNSKKFYFKTVASGNFSDATIWLASPNNSTDWTTVLDPPNYRSSGIVISSGDSVVFNATDTLDQVTVNGILNYGTGCTLKLNNGTGVDLAIANSAKFYDNGDNNIVWNSATWTLGTGAYLIRTRATSSDNFRNQYDGGITNIPASSYWIIRKTGSDDPTLSSLSSMHYGNLYIENNTGTTWITPAGSSFTGSSDYPTIKGNMSIGGNGTGNVSFLDTNTNAHTTLVQGDFTINSGSIFRNHGTGFEIQGNVNLNGIDSTSSSSVIRLSGSNLQTLSGSNLSFKNLRIHKTTSVATVSLTTTCTIRGSLKLDTGVIVSDTVHLLTFNAGSTTTGVNDSSFVSGPVKKIGNTVFTFPLGKNTNSQTIAISAPSSSTDAFQAEYFDTNPTTIYGVYTDTTFNYISTCEYFVLKRTNGTSNIQPTLSYDPTACISNLLPAPRVIGYNGTKWKDLGITNLTYAPTGGTVSSGSVITTYGAITLGNYNPLITNTPTGDTCFAAIPMPSGATSTLTGQTQSTGHKWYTFTPTTSEVKITLTNTSMGSNHIHDLVLLEGLCYEYMDVGYDSSRKDTTLTIILHEAMVGAPYFLMTFRERSNCSMCSSSANFNLKVECLTPPTQTVSNGIVFFNGYPSHRDEQIVVSVNKVHLNMSNVDNVSLSVGIASQFFDATVTQSMAALLFNNDTAYANNLSVKKAFPTLTSADSMSLSRDSQYVKMPPVYEVFIITIPKETHIFKTSRILSTSVGINYAQPNLVGVLTSTPNDSHYGTDQASLHYTTTYPNSDIKADYAWDTETGQSFVKIGVYDSGIDGTHPDLNGGKVGGGYDYTANTSISSGVDNDGSGHGTACAGIIGAYRNNTIGIAGIAGGDDALGNPGCTLFDMKIANGSTYVDMSTMWQAILDGSRSTSSGGYGLHIMNHSWALTTLMDNTLHGSVRFAAQSGVIFCASRGNYFPFTDPCSNGESGTLTLSSVQYPSCFQDEMVLNIGASGIDGEWKTTSNGSSASCDSYQSMTGKNIDVIAPGTSPLVYTTAPGNSYAQFHGTSAATPHVAGVAGLLLSHYDQPNPSPNNLVIEDVEYILQQSALDKIGTPASMGYDDYSGWGLVNAFEALGEINNGNPVFKIQHFGTGQNATSPTPVLSLVNTAVYVNLNEPFNGLLPSNYFANRWKVTVTLNYQLSDPNDVILAAYPRFSSTIGWAHDSPLSADNSCNIVSVTPTQAVLETYIYDFYADANGHHIDPWMPTDVNGVKVALSIYTSNSTISGINKINGIDDLVLSVYPNPTQNNANINVTLSKPQQISLDLYDVQGKLIKSIAKEKAANGRNQYHVSLDDVAQGVYYVKLIAEETTYDKKLIKVK